MPEDARSFCSKVLSVAVAERLFTERALDPAGDRVADPDDAAEEQQGKSKPKRGCHESNLRYASFTATRVNSQLIQLYLSHNGTGSIADGASSLGRP